MQPNSSMAARTFSGEPFISESRGWLLMNSSSCVSRPSLHCFFPSFSKGSLESDMRFSHKHFFFRLVEHFFFFFFNWFV